MRRRLLYPLLLATVALLAWQRCQTPRKVADLTTPPTPTPTEDRVTPARAHCGAKIAARCRDAGVSYPPRELFLRAFKAERELEAWARGDDGPFHLVAKWPVLAASGEPGPKRREGDRQVPEGCYRVGVFNPLSNFHLSLGLDYPNASDRVRSDATQPGSDIYIHGGGMSIGCIAIGDDGIEELFLLASDTREKPVEVHIFPARMVGDAWASLRARLPEQASFWAELQPIHDAFEASHVIPSVTVQPNGRYELH